LRTSRGSCMRLSCQKHRISFATFGFYVRESRRRLRRFSSAIFVIKIWRYGL
ncbi:hypothetical protein H0H92_012475, partial [Tricholoma furcatifolium]